VLHGTYMAYQFTASPLLARKTLHRCRDITYVNLNFAKVDVASSSLVTRSSPESFRGWSECAAALAKAGRPNAPSYGLQASLVMYYVEVEIVSGKTIRRLETRSTPAA
jgi:hypothetical protein